MASITKIDKKWRAQIRRKGHKAISKWFDTKAQAALWAEDIEKQIAAGSKVVTQIGDETIGHIVKRYRTLRSKTRPIVDTSNEHYTLKMIERTLGHQVARHMDEDTMVAWAIERKEEGVAPYTFNMDLSRLSTVLRYTTKGLLDIVQAARPKLTYLGLIGGANMRERRPTEDEMERILEWLRANKGQVYRDFTLFAAITAMRQGEIAAIKWEDIDREARLILAWRKHPRKGKTLERVPMLGDSMTIMARQPVEEGVDTVFGLHPQTVSKYFTEACRELSIPDLHFHDLRHEGISVMFEHGFDIPHVAAVSGHKDWRHLKRYTQIKPAAVHRRAHELGTRPDSPPDPEHHTSGPHPRKS